MPDTIYHYSMMKNQNMNNLSVITNEKIDNDYEKVLQYTRYNGDIVYILTYKSIDFLHFKSSWDWCDDHKKFIDNGLIWSGGLVLDFKVSHETVYYFDKTETIVLYPLKKFIETDISKLDKETLAFIKKYGQNYICFT